jgi:hypothetical protein
MGDTIVRVWGAVLKEVPDERISVIVALAPAPMDGLAGVVLVVACLGETGYLCESVGEVR